MNIKHILPKFRMTFHRHFTIIHVALFHLNEQEHNLVWIRKFYEFWVKNDKMALVQNFFASSGMLIDQLLIATWRSLLLPAINIGREPLEHRLPPPLIQIIQQKKP